MNITQSLTHSLNQSSRRRRTTSHDEFCLKPNKNPQLASFYFCCLSAQMCHGSSFVVVGYNARQTGSDNGPATYTVEVCVPLERTTGTVVSTHDGCPLMILYIDERYDKLTVVSITLKCNFTPTIASWVQVLLISGQKTTLKHML